MPGERLVFARHIPKAGHLDRLRLVDLFLDPLVYNAHTTPCDAL
jgi:predicted O-linked N-acetylglucosamine transferase (SPINDLY family)